jgi:hypothetical protein
MQNISQSHRTLNVSNKHLHSEYRKGIEEKNAAQTKSSIQSKSQVHAAPNKTNYELGV